MQRTTSYTSSSPVSLGARAFTALPMAIYNVCSSAFSLPLTYTLYPSPPVSQSFFLLPFFTGWLKTVDSYYSGSNNTIQHANVNSIISANVLALAENPGRKFIYVEQVGYRENALLPFFRSAHAAPTQRAFHLVYTPLNPT
jgi:hypothetical protein